MPGFDPLRIRQSNPSRRETICPAGRSGATGADTAVKAARAAQESRLACPTSERSAILTKLGNRYRTIGHGQ
ncbi:MAG: aldehyde dehydrogenase family protein [Rhodospirillales bacterium]|nr:aldehyde dehydrogenase family protein [Rhodospirillales bacterium]